MPTYSANQYLVDWFSQTGQDPKPNITIDSGTVTLGAGTAEAAKVTINLQPNDQWPPISGDGRSLLFGTIAQTAVETTQLVASDSDELYYIADYVVVLDVAGTFKFTDGTADLIGAIPADANGGAVVIGAPNRPLFKTGATSRPLNIVTTGGKAFGHFAYYKASS